MKSQNSQYQVLHLNETTGEDPEIEEVYYKSLLYFLFIKEEYSEDLKAIFPLMQALSHFNNLSFSNKENYDISGKYRFEDLYGELALIYNTWENAIKFLNGIGDFNVCNKDINKVKEKIQFVKARLNNELKVLPIRLNRQSAFKESKIKRIWKFFFDSKAHEEIIHVPFINTNTMDAPWYSRLLSRSYQFGILYEVIGNKIVVIPWSRDGKSVPDLSETIRNQIGKDYSLVFAA